MGKGWIGVDLDGTLATYDGFVSSTHIGEPVLVMATRVRGWVARGKDVRIFTARCDTPEALPIIEAWCEKHLGVVLPITNIKDRHCYEIWDDRAVSVERNTGKFVSANEVRG